MTERSTEALVEALAAEASPVRPLAPPMARAAAVLLAFFGAGALVVAWAGSPAALAARYAGREMLMVAETAAMLATGIVALCGAFALSVPGGSRRWLGAAAAALLAWLLVSGAGCWALVESQGAATWRLNGHPACFYFIVAAGAAVGAPLLWLLSRARPIDPAPVALLGGLGAAALARGDRGAPGDRRGAAAWAHPRARSVGPRRL